MRSSSSHRHLVLLPAVALLLILAPEVRAGFLDFLGLGSGKSAPAVAALASALPEEQVIAGLKEALGKGVKNAVSQLGRTDGFLTNLTVRIPVPENLQKAERMLRAVGEGKLADDFTASLNRAAEKAVPEAAAVFGDAIQQMSIADAKSILSGPKDAATQFFARTTRTNLAQRFLPLVKAATAQVGVTSAYKQMAAKVNAADALGGGLLGGLRRSVVDDRALDLDGYVTDKALDGLFVMVADEEKRIRENPVARTSELLQKVFGAVVKK